MQKKKEANCCDESNNIFLRFSLAKAIADAFVS